jgi:hypothetical protein
MFRNPVIAFNYPLPRRNSAQKGLEISTGLMCLLSQAQMAVVFCGRCLLKGYNSMLVPVERLTSSVLWRFLVDKTGDRLPYTAGCDLSNLQDFTVVFFEGVRHFVGWTSNATFLTGQSCFVTSLRLMMI